MSLRIGLILGILLVALSAAAMIGFDPEPARREIDLRARVGPGELRELAPRLGRDVYIFGFERRGNPSEDARRYLSFLNYLSRATGYRFELRFIPRNGSIIHDLGRGRIHFAAVGAGTFAKAWEGYGVRPVARAVDAAGRTTCRSVIVVPQGSAVRKVEQLKGLRFAFGSFNSTQGHMIPRIVLARHGVTLNDLAFVEYAGSHRGCANAVVAGRADAGGLQEKLGLEMEKAGLLRVIGTSPDFPSIGIAASPEVPPETLRKVQAALIDFQPAGRDRAGLHRWEETEMARGFAGATPEDYRDISAWAARLGLVPRAPR